jgi:hypothetical protein
MKEGFDLHDRSSVRRILRFVLLAVIIGFGVNIILSLRLDRSHESHHVARLPERGPGDALAVKPCRRERP